MKDTLFFALLTLVTALALSAVAIFYSVSGIMAVFASAPISAMIMGGMIEASKLVSIVWLHHYWDRAQRAVRAWLVLSVIILMIITSGGIFGFLSKAHTDQAAASAESQAQIERVHAEIARNQAIIQRAEEKIKKTEQFGSGADANIQAQIDREQKRIDQALSRIAEADQTQQARIEPFQKELNAIDSLLASLQTAINQNQIRQAQRIIGANPDGQYGPKTAQAVEDFRTQQSERRKILLERIDSIRAENPAALVAKSQIQESNDLINRLRANLGQTDGRDIDETVDAAQEKIRIANQELDRLTQRKFELEASNRVLEAKVGPIKFIAEAIYGESEDGLLEKAVTWFIVMIVVVFDPLAVVLLIASQFTFIWYQREKESQQVSDEPKEKNEIKETVQEPAISVPETFENEIEIDEDDLIERLLENIDIAKDPEIAEILENDQALRKRLEERLDVEFDAGRETVVKPKEDVNPRKSWL